MSVRTSTPVGAPIWIDLATSDIARSQAFYGEVFGWTFESSGPEYGGYVTALKDGRPVAGLMSNDPQWNSPDGWTTYLHTTDAKATLAKAFAAGATTCGMDEPMPVPDKGVMGLLADTDGAFVGLWQPTGHRGFDLVNEHGAPVYFQWTGRDIAKAQAFYQEVFGWQIEVVSDTDEFRYRTALFDGEALLGMMDGSAFLPEGVPSNWSFYFGADDVDKSVQQILDNGGSVVRDAEDTPYGRLAAVADPTGAAFNLSSLQ
ncbi:VOC family protein [Mycolicibacterium flavescens]|uniref:Hydroxylase n=1 Tax=Mycolicibacterium flavescens TaxID=1776 RepID=A0A1E3RF35_MYCFV|nr:VOC family protein [Mycolicibacterium flavescens]MCV7280713.1 VOC family protein [Mycolicibacterium flavescens]ODQ88062.1 hydroxylase [Mycolicibacterium flavescens]